MNLCVNIISEDYSGMYCVESIDSDEAVANGGHIVGAVGRLAESTKSNAMIMGRGSCIFSTDRAEEDRWYRDTLKIRLQFDWQARIQRSGGKKWNSFTSGLAKVVVIGGFGSIPFIVIAGLTHCDAGESTSAQRAWLMTWLVLGCWFGPFMASGHPESYRRATLWNKGYFPLMAPGIGGMVVVAQMLLAYGWCTRFDDITSPVNATRTSM